MSSSAELPVTLDEVIEFVGRLHPDADPLLQLQDAVVVGERLESLGDDLVGHYVHEARAGGATWSAIGDSMGVTKQAAQQRFVVALGDRDDGLLSRFTPRARHALASARDEARRLGSSEVGTAHLVLGLSSEPEGLAMVVMSEMGATADRIREAVGAGAPDVAARGGKRVPFAAEARTALQAAVEEALHLGHNYIGTEHLLLAVLDMRDSEGAVVLAELGVTKRKATTRLKRALAEIVAARTRA
jgi:hypothetical protein